MPSTQYPSNSNNKREKKEFVAQATGTTDDGILNRAWDYILNSVLIPTLKRAISDAISGGVDILLFGTTTRTPSSQRSQTYTSYDKYYHGPDTARQPVRYSGYSSARQPATPYFNTREDAEDVLAALGESLEDFGMVTVSEMYDLCGLESKYPDNYYGWDNLNSARIIETRRGWAIEFPRVKAL